MGFSNRKLMDVKEKNQKEKSKERKSKNSGKNSMEGKEQGNDIESRKRDINRIDMKQNNRFILHKYEYAKAEYLFIYNTKREDK